MTHPTTATANTTVVEPAQGITAQLADRVLLAQGAPPNAPSSPWMGIDDEVKALAEQWVRWAMYLGLFVAVCAAIILLSMMAIDRNRGEAGIASSDQARMARFALGLGLVACGPQVVGWLIAATPW